MNALRTIFGVGACFLMSALHAEGIEGDWVTQGYSARVQISSCAQTLETLCGKINWLWEAVDQNGKQKFDSNNPSASRRFDPLIGLAILRSFRNDGKNRWSDGTIYDPESGRTYKSSLTLRDATTLEVSGCVLFVCRTQIWRRAEAICPLDKSSEGARAQVSAKD